MWVDECGWVGVGVGVCERECVRVSVCEYVSMHNLHNLSLSLCVCRARARSLSLSLARPLSLSLSLFVCVSVSLSLPPSVRPSLSPLSLPLSCLSLAHSLTL
jgi:hypothetical protein